MSVLGGLKVLEIAAIGPGPFCGMLLADLGAEVVVVEQRQKAPGEVDLGEGSLINRGKKSIVLDLKSAGDVKHVLALARWADVLIEGFRPGVMERLGLGPEVCLAGNSRLVFGRMTGWGQDGPRAHSAGHDMNYTALSGGLWYSGQPGTSPVAPASIIGDIGGALYLAVGLLSAVMRARETGRGAVVDAAIVDANAHMMSVLLALRQLGLMVDERGRSVLDGAHWSQTYRCACGGHMAVQCYEDKFYRIFLEKLGLENDPAMADQFDPAQWPRQTRRLEEIFLTRTRRQWDELFCGTDACVAPVLSVSEASVDAHMRARGIYVAAESGLQARPAPRFSGEGHPLVRPAPARGEHTAEILKLCEEYAG